MRFGYMLSDVECELSTYESHLKCPDALGENKALMSFYKTFVKRTEDIIFVPFEILTPDATSNFSSNVSLLGALAHGVINAVVPSFVVTPNRFEILSFTTPHAFDRICFYTKRPETTPITDEPLFFITPFSIQTWLLLALTLAVVQLSSLCIDNITIDCSRRNRCLSLKLMNCTLLLTEGLISVSYLAALREVLIETGSLKPPFRNRFVNGTNPCIEYKFGVVLNALIIKGHL